MYIGGKITVLYGEKSKKYYLQMQQMTPAREQWINVSKYYCIMFFMLKWVILFTKLRWSHDGRGNICR